MTSRVHSADEIEVCEEVGRGGFGVVYRGLVKSNNKEIAIKQIDLENDKTDLYEINKEIQILSECRSPQITEYLGCFVKNYRLWVIMEYVDGGSMFEILKAGEVQDEMTISFIAKEILVALNYLHGQGKIHRDLKSQNILMNKKGEVKLTDFGVSTQLSSNFSRRNTTVGTPYWMAPEVILNNNGGHSFKADVWSLGCCAYELFNGKPPLQMHFPPMKALRQISKCTRNETFLDLIELDGLQTSAEFKDFLHKCFQIDPKNRSSAASLLTHKFITSYKNPEEGLKRVRKLIIRKHLWDQEHHVLTSQKFYIPTEIQENQKKWRDNDTIESKTIKFDISTINIGGSELKESNGISLQKNDTGANGSPRSPNRGHNGRSSYHSISPVTRSEDLKQSLQTEMTKIVNKVFAKLESRGNLTTEQYDLLVSLNDNILNLLTFMHTSDYETTSNKKILIFQYLKYFLKELSKTVPVSLDVDNPRIMLQRLIVPSNFKANKLLNETMPNEASRNSRYNSQIFEIENSLFESWITKMKENWAPA